MSETRFVAWKFLLSCWFNKELIPFSKNGVLYLFKKQVKSIQIRQKKFLQLIIYFWYSNLALFLIFLFKLHKFELENYENTVINNLSTNISDRIIFSISELNEW